MEKLTQNYSQDWPKTNRTSLLSPFYVAFVGVVLIVFLYELWFRNSRAYKLLANMPTPPRLPLIGHAHHVIGLTSREIMRTCLDYYRKYGETVWAVNGHRIVVFITNPADIEIILSSSEHLEKSEEYRFFKPWFRDGLLISKGAHWQHHRKMIAPTFHQSILKSFMPKFVEYSENVVKKFSKLTGKEIDVHDYMSETTVEILLSTVMGVKNLPSGSECANYAKAVVDMCDIIHRRQIQLNYHFDILFKLTKLNTKLNELLSSILALTQRVITERIKNFNVESDGIFDTKDANESKVKKQDGFRDDLDDIDENDVGTKRRLALLDAMLEMSKNPNNKWTEKDITDEVNTLMFEGHDTTSAGSSFLLCLLGIHKDVQDKVYEEQKAIFGNDMNRPCTFADTIDMHYLERVIKETLRLYPPVPIIARKVNTDVRLASGPYTIPNGSTVVIGQYAVHRNSNTYKDPEKFNPDNFLPEEVSKRHYYSYIPFSAGPRSCVGRKYAMLMLKVLISTIIRRYSVHSNITEPDFELQGDIILKLSKGFNVAFTLRT
ncbi:cytochrome P450 4g1-like [Teleopsis dalmanni]|uniref:cytochrome P450 4g1-like n=1 Tax=Teleopsis dalmanni TaxID=139649 RepID=UPI0018CE3860|nr:cytochrome P450 4g1-like [Teleopsis dalmanni]